MSCFVFYSQITFFRILSLGATLKGGDYRSKQI
ncbi:hypothetical protein CY0110_19157 [Crocosphaera chwakensis CCY0110]|uniref:Uncharacterized protein n=1 Tax=Crocosphaera chwakensis CCY0110 TaxID=391612 RepID=A3IJG3_9CHRO|nr:hypothetical protein CY0110_19157 [Crocosphaera chwakensis CCY0110]